MIEFSLKIITTVLFVLSLCHFCNMILTHKKLQSQIFMIKFYCLHSQIKDFYLIEQTIISGQQHLALPICIVYDIVVSAIIAL